jgi:nitrogen fixation-related uncharacterized protein
MKKSKKRIIAIVIAAVVLIALFVPFRSGTYDDGGTRDWQALAYRIVKWNKEILPDGETEARIYSAARVYWFPRNFYPIALLWETGK